MKLFVENISTEHKVYLRDIAPTRRELAQLIGSAWFNIDGHQYHVNQVIAEHSNSNTATGAVVGGLIGLLAGPVGVVIGGALGGALGNGSDKSEEYNVERFNNSRL